MKRKPASEKGIRTAPGFHRKIDRMRRALAILLACSACGHSPRKAAEERYRTALAAFRHGELAPALEQSRSGARHTSPSSPLFYKFRLLEAEILSYQSNRQAAAAILSNSIPGAAGFAAVEARRKMLQI